MPAFIYLAVIKQFHQLRCLLEVQISQKLNLMISTNKSSFNEPDV